jgi:hypothetical protein
MIISQKLWPLHHKAGHNEEMYNSVNECSR